MFVRTRRLTLRPAWPEDARELSRAIGHEIVTRNLTRVPWPYTPDDAAAFIAAPRDRGEVALLICEHLGGATRIVGGAGIHPEDGAFELGYWLTPDCWGRGYATEAGRAMVHLARYAMGLTRLGARHFTDNPASGKVLRKLGFEPTGRVLPCHSVARGGEAPSIELALDLSANAPCDIDCRMPVAA